MTTKIVIPEEAMEKVRIKISTALFSSTHRDSVNTKITGLTRLIRGWYQYYQYTSKASIQFHKLGNELLWEMAHWLGLDFGHSGIAPLQTRQGRAGVVLKIGEVWWGGRHHEIRQPLVPLQLSPRLAAIFLLSGPEENGQSRVKKFCLHLCGVKPTRMAV